MKLQVVIAIKKPNCKASCKSPYFLIMLNIEMEFKPLIAPWWKEW
jgi:hypothetical protein